MTVDQNLILTSLKCGHKPKSLNLFPSTVPTEFRSIDGLGRVSDLSIVDVVSFGLVSPSDNVDDDMMDNINTQTNDTIATKNTRKCGGTNVKLIVCAGAHTLQYFHNKL